MYTPAHFSVQDPASLHRVICEHPLGILVTPTGHGMDANHIPFEFDPAVGPCGLQGRAGFGCGAFKKQAAMACPVA